MTSSRPIYFRKQVGPNDCGQTCVAMLLGCSIEEAVKLVGKRGLTGTRHIRAALEACGWTLGDRINAKTVRPEKGKVYMARVHWRKGGNRTHWVIVNAEGIIVDPAYGFDPEWMWEGVAYITSFYEVGPPPSADG